MTRGIEGHMKTSILSTGWNWQFPGRQQGLKGFWHRSGARRGPMPNTKTPNIRTSNGDNLKDPVSPNL